MRLGDDDLLMAIIAVLALVGVWAIFLWVMRLW